ncbi:MAG TPA: hypothetical protein VLY24_14440 [Bryobacteraceae bacterium]|nr:hypothetical protein [Bryobacteraceae bacterium]
MLVKITFLLAAFLVPLSAQWEDLKSKAAPRAKDGAPNLSAPAPRRADGKPDLTGIWIADPPKLRDVTMDLKPGEVEMQPWAEKVFKERETGELSGLDPDANCLPQGVPKIDTTPLPFKIFQEPDVIVILYEAFDQFRQLFLDGRKLPKDPNPQWFGYSVARWDGNTLVVESSGFNGKAWLDQVGHPSSTALRVTERFTRRDFGHMDVVSTIDDAMAYRKPWTFTQPLKLLADTELLELVCNENNKDLPHLKGK